MPECLLGQNVLLSLCVNLKLNINTSLALERELARASLGPSPYPSSFLRALPMEHQGTNPSEATERLSVSTPGAHLKSHRTLSAPSSFTPTPPHRHKLQASPSSEQQESLTSINHTGPPQAVVPPSHPYWDDVGLLASFSVLFLLPSLSVEI